MRDLDQMLDRAGADVHKSVRERTSPTPSKVHRRVRRRRVVSVTGWVLIAGLVIGGGSRFLGGGADLASSEEDELITSEMILEDGVVTEDEYRAGALAVAACMADAGFDTEADFDRANGHASFSGGDANNEAFNRCRELHLSDNVSLGWQVALGQLDLGELREETTAVTECVEQETGQDFGELTYDEFGYLTASGQQTKDAAFEYQDHEPWLRCQNDLGYLEDYKADTRALLECVEERTGEDFGTLAFDDETGYPDDESQQTLRAAQDFQDHQVWEACQEDLGIRTSQVVISDR